MPGPGTRRKVILGTERHSEAPALFLMHLFPNASPLVSPSRVTWALGGLGSQGGDGCFKKTRRRGGEAGGRQSLNVKLNKSGLSSLKNRVMSQGPLLQP